MAPARAAQYCIERRMQINRRHHDLVSYFNYVCRMLYFASAKYRSISTAECNEGFCVVCDCRCQNINTVRQAAQRAVEGDYKIEGSSVNEPKFCNVVVATGGFD